MNTMNPYIYSLPKAQSGMNLRGARNQLVKQEQTEKNVGTWFRDAGKWLLNTLATPFELISGTNFYDPEMSYGGWQGFNDVFEGTAKGVGDALGYVYGGPAYGAVKSGISGIADAAGAKDQIAGAQYGGKIKKYQTQGQVTTPIGANPMGSNVFSFQQNFDTQEQMQDFANLMSSIMGVYGTGIVSSPQTQPQTSQQQPKTDTTVGKDYFKNMQHGSQYMSGPDSAQGWSGAVMEAASNPMQAIGNLAGGIANAGKDPVVAKDYKTYRDITANTGSHPGDLIKSTADIIAGTDPVSYQYAQQNQKNADMILNSNKPMRGIITRSQLGGQVENPQARAFVLDSLAKTQGGIKNTPLKIGQAIQHIGGVVGESLSGLGMGGGGDMGGMMNMFGGGGDQGGMMGNIMGMFGGGEGGSGGGGFMDAIGGMFGGESGDNFNFGNIMSGIGGMMGMEYGGMIPNYQNGGREGNRTPFQQYLAEPSLEGSGRHASDTLIYNDPRRFDFDSPETWGQSISRSGDDQALAKAFTETYTDLSSLLPGGKKYWEDERYLKYLNNARKTPHLNSERTGEGVDAFARVKPTPIYQNGGNEDLLLMVPNYAAQYDTIPYSGGGGTQLYNDPFANKEKYPVPQGMQFTQRDSLLGKRDRGIELTPSEIKSLGPEADPNFKIFGRVPSVVDPSKMQNGGRLEKTSDLPMDMQGFTDLEPGFRKSNMIEINSGNNHSALKNPHTPLNVPVPSFDEQGNAMTENVPILAEPGEFVRKDPETGAVTIFSKNLGFAKPAEKLGKKEERLLEKAKNPYDDISNATIQRALNNVKNQFIRLEEEQKVAKELKEEEDRMDLFELAKNGGRITKKNTYRMGGKVKKLSEYQKDLLGMDDQEQMPMAQDGASFEDLTSYNRWKRLAGLDPDERKKEIEEIKKERKQNKEARKKNREEERKQRREGRDFQKNRTRGDTDPSDLAKEIAELPGGGSEKVLDPYTNEGARKAKKLIEEEYGPLTPEGGLPQPPVEEPPGGVAIEEEPDAADKNMMRRMSSGDDALNDYIRNLRNINAAVEARFEPYPNFFEDYGRESESIARNMITDLPEYYLDRASQLASANVNSLENAIRNMGQSMGTSGYLAQMQAAKNKELAANQAYTAQAAAQREKQLGLLSNLLAQNELYERTGAEKSFDLTQQAKDAIDAAKYDTEKNILTARLAQEREANMVKRNELLDQQMQWMYRNDPARYDKQGNEITSSGEYGGKIKRSMYEYGSRVKKERQKKSDKAIADFRSFMKDYNSK